jgi:glyoxylase-like metal-dependent hydrolase (beta-lactamase superfamily II)/rhodanese-related sulfurtransferase
MENQSISTQKLQHLLDMNKPVFILDVRPQDQREEWHIPGSVHKDAYQKLKAGDTSVLDDVTLPDNTPVVTVCAAGKVSQMAADALRQKGIEAYSLEGGMKAWNYDWNTAKLSWPESDIKIIQVRRAAKGCLSYVVGSAHEAIVVDASLDPDVYLQITQEQGWSIRYVMDTHIHADYLSRTRELAVQSGAEHVLIEAADVDFPFSAVKDQQILSFGSAQVRILHTPGHTWESTSYLIHDKVILTGDTLFTDGVGRPDLKADQQEAKRKAAQLYASLQQILVLSQDTLVLPAHTTHAVPFEH